MKTLTLHIILFAALALLFAGCDLSPDADTVSVTGKIVTNGSGVSGVTIILSGTEGVITTVTDENGNFTFTGAWPGHYTITSSKTGYTFPDGAISLTVSDTSCTVPSIEAVSIWSSVIGTELDEQAEGIVVGDGCYYVVGSQKRSVDNDGETVYPNSDITVKKLDLGGSLLWEKFYGSTETEDYGHSIVLTSDSSLVVVGSSGIISDGRIIKIDLDGEVMWSNTYGGMGNDKLNNVIVASDGSIIAVGSTNSTGDSNDGSYSFTDIGDGNINGWILHINSDGTFINHNVFGGSSEDSFSQVIALSESRYGIVGHTGSYKESVDGNEYDIWFVIVDSSLNETLSKSYNIGNNDYGKSLASDSEGNIYLTGYGEVTSYHFYAQVVIKVDSGGEFLWERAYDAGTVGDSDWAFGCSVTSSDTLLVAGATYTASMDLTIRNIDSDGTTLWFASVGGVFEDQGLYVTTDGDYGFLVVGYTEFYGSGNEDFWILRGDKNGNIVTE